MAKINVSSECKVHNHFIIERYKDDECIGKDYAFNLVTNMAYNRMLAGDGIPRYIALGKGSGEPAVSDTQLFSMIQGWTNTSYNDVYDFETMRITRTITLTITPEERPGMSVTEIGLYVNSTSQLYTHAMITDNNGQPISLVKGELEKWVITAIVYVDINIAFPEQSKVKYDPLALMEFWLAIFSGNNFAVQCGFVNTNRHTPITGICDSNMYSSASSAEYVTTQTHNTSEMTKTYTTKLTTKITSWDCEFFGLCAGFNIYQSSSYAYQGLQRPVFWIPISELGGPDNNPYTIYNQELATGDGIQTEFSLPFAVNDVSHYKIYKKGQLMQPSDYILHKKSPVFAYQRQGDHYTLTKCGERYFTTNYYGNYNYGVPVGFIWYKWNEEKTELVFDEIVPFDPSTLKLIKSGYHLEHGVIYISSNSVDATYSHYIFNPLTGKIMWKYKRSGGNTSLEGDYVSGNFREIAPDLSWISNGFGRINLDSNMRPVSQSNYNRSDPVNVIDTGMTPPLVVRGTATNALKWSPTYDTYEEVPNVRGNYWCKIPSQNVKFDFSKLKAEKKIIAQKLTPEGEVEKTIEFTVDNGTLNYASWYSNAQYIGACYLSGIDCYVLYDFRNTSASMGPLVWLDWEREKYQWKVMRQGTNNSYPPYYTNHQWGVITNGTTVDVCGQGYGATACNFYDIEFKTPPAAGDTITFDVSPDILTKDSNWDVTVAFTIKMGR